MTSWYSSGGGAGVVLKCKPSSFQLFITLSSKCSFNCHMSWKYHFYFNAFKDLTNLEKKFSPIFFPNNILPERKIVIWMQLESPEGQIFIPKFQWLYNTLGSLNMYIRTCWMERNVFFILYAHLILFYNAFHLLPYKWYFLLRINPLQMVLLIENKHFVKLSKFSYL